MQTVIEEKIVFNEERLKALAKAFNDWGALKKDHYFPDGLFTEISASLLEKYGYFNEDHSLKISYFIHLLNQAKEIIENSRKYLGSIEPFFLDEIDIPDNKKGMILLIKEDNKKISIKLPSEVLKINQN